MFFGKSELKVRDQMLVHVQLVQKTLLSLIQVIDVFIENTEDLEKSTYEVHRLEHQADVERRGIQQQLAGGAFMPFYREDYIMLTEMIDKVANRAVDFAKALSLERPQFPSTVKPGLRDIAQCAAETFIHFEKIIPALFSEKDKEVLKLTEKVSAGEQKADSLEWKLQKAVFGDNTIDRAEQIVLARIVQRLSSILDSIENAADKVRLIVVKKS